MENPNKKAKLIVFLTVFVDLVGFGMIIPLSPYLAREFGADALDVGLLMTVYSLGQFLFSPFWGQVSDRVGRRPVILISLFGAAVAHFAFAWASALWVLFVARSFAGIFGANISTAMAYMADISKKQDRSKSMGLVGAAFGLGFIVGPFLGGLLSLWGQALGEHPPFGNQMAAVGAGALCLGNFLFALKALPESWARGQKIQQKLKASRWLLISRTLSRPTVGPLILVFFLTTLAMAHMENALFLYLQDEVFWDLSQASFGFAYVGLILVFTQGFLIRKLMPQWGERLVLLTGLCLAALGFGGMGVTAWVPFLAVSVTFLGLGIGLSNPSVTGSVSLLTSEEDQGEVLGVNHSLSALGRIIGPALGGWFYRDLGHSIPFFVAAMLTLAGMLVVGIIFSRLPETGRSKVAS